MLLQELIEKHIAETTFDSMEFCTLINRTINYVEVFQRKPIGYYRTHNIPPKTEQAIELILLNIDNLDIKNSLWNSINSLLLFNANNNL